MSRKIWQPEHPTPGWIQAQKDSDLTIYLPHPEGGVPMFFRHIPAGEFRMGSRGNDARHEPVHLISIPYPSYLSTFPVTQVQYRAIAEAMDCIPDPSLSRGDLRPVNNVSWENAYCTANWLTESGILPKGWCAGLPTEAQWEYACRAGTETEYWNGDGEAALSEVGWYDQNSGSETHPVGKLPANPWGLYDMHGNVAEWCTNVYDDKAYRTRVDGASEFGVRIVMSNNKIDQDGVLRGGSYDTEYQRCSSAHRNFYWSNSAYFFYGYRLSLFPISNDLGDIPLHDSPSALP